MTHVKVNGKPKGGVFITLPQPKPSVIPKNVDPRTGEVLGRRMDFHSEDNVASWWDPLCEIFDSMHDTPRKTGKPFVDQKNR